MPVHYKFGKSKHMSILLSILALAACAGVNAPPHTADEAVKVVAYCQLPYVKSGELVQTTALYMSRFDESIFLDPDGCIPGLAPWVSFDPGWERRTSVRIRKWFKKYKSTMPLLITVTGKMDCNGKHGHLDLYVCEFTIFKIDRIGQSRSGTPYP